MLRTFGHALLAGVGALLFAQQAGAVDERVRRACRDDYHAFCSQHEVGSEALRTCMRKADKKLSRGCIDALVASGEVSGKEIERRRAEKR